MKNKYFIYISMIMLFSALIVGCKTESKIGHIAHTELVFDTVFDVKLLDDVDEKIFDEMSTYLKNLELNYSTQNYDSDISKFNRLKQTREFPISKEIIEMLDTAYYYCTITNGTYDFTIQPVLNAWNFDTKDVKMPDRDLLLEALSHVNYKNIKINATNLTLEKLDPEAMITLDSVAKGYALDNLVTLVKENEISSGIMSLGNHTYAIGNNNEASSIDGEFVGWSIEIATPSPDQNPEALGYVNISNASVVTKTIYDGAYEKNGIYFHNIFDITNGYPVNNGIESITVIAPKAVDADALSTLFFTLDKNEILQLASILDQVEVLLVTKENTIYTTKKLGESFIQSNPIYTLIKAQN